MALRENEIARQTPSGLDVRAEPLRVKWEFPDLVASDGHELRCHFSVSARAVADRTERQVLEEVLLAGRTALFTEDVSRHFYAAMRAAAARIAQGHDGKQWIEEETFRPALTDALKAAATSVAFACGLEILPPFQLDLQSPSYERLKVTALQQALAEKEAAGQVERFQRSAEMLKQFQALRSAAPEMSAGQVLERVSANDRGSLMQALLMAGARENSAKALWAVAGPYLVRVDLKEPLSVRPQPPAQLIPLPPTLGPLRSVQVAELNGRRALLVGAQRGFMLVHQESPSDAKLFHDAGFESALGFNRVVYWEERRQFCATHSEAGLVCWDADRPDAPVDALRPAALGIFPTISSEPPTMASMSISMRSGSGPLGPRNLYHIDGDTLIFSAGGRVLAWDGNAARTISETSRSEVAYLFAERKTVQIVHEDGTIASMDIDGKSLSSDRRFGRIRSAAVLPWMGGWRFLLAPDDGPVQCIGMDDPVVTQYFSSYRGLRALAATAGLVAAVSPDRQRLILWNSWDGRQPAGELFIGAQARHRIADMVFS